MSALENFVNNVRTLTASENFVELNKYLHKSLDVLKKNYAILNNVLETLDVQNHSLGYLYVLLAKFLIISTTPLPGNNTDLSTSFNQLKDFIYLCNTDQIIRVTGALQSYYDLCHSYTNIAMKDPKKSIQGISLMAQAIENIRETNTRLAPIHADLCQLSLKAMCFDQVKKYLDIDITEVATTEDNHSDSKYFLLYYYYGGMIYTAMKNYERALYFYEVALNTPALTMSYIMLEAYKKFILVSLILNGKIIALPKYPSQIVSRFLKPLCQPYQELATAYRNSMCEDLKVVINKHNDTFTRDQTMGLVKIVSYSLYKKNIQRLTKTFLTLSLADVAQRVQLPSAKDAESYILNMIKSGEVYATINQKDGMVVFKNNPEKYDSGEMFLKIQEDMNNAMELNKRIKNMEEEVKLNQLFIKKLVTQEDEISSKTIVKHFTQ